MNNLSQAIWVELLKMRRSPMPLLTVLGFSLGPFVGGFFMIILKDPELARRMGVISSKAQMLSGSADWTTYLGLIAQVAALGGFILFSFIASWVFGREYSDHTLKDLLALPTRRTSIVLAKFVVILLWAAALTLIIYLISLVVGAAVGLPATTSELFWQGTWTLIQTAALTVILVTPIAFFANAGRGYLPPMGAAVLAVVLAQVVAATGYGEFFPWSIPALGSGMAGPEYAQLGWMSYVIVLVTGLVGIAATFYWWQTADQNR